MNYRLVSARHVRDYVVRLRFSDGTEGEVDLEPALEGPVLAPLREPTLFARFEIHPLFRTLTWPNGADLAPEYLHDRVAQVKRSAA